MTTPIPGGGDERARPGPPDDDYDSRDDHTSFRSTPDTPAAPDDRLVAGGPRPEEEDGGYATGPDPAAHHGDVADPDPALRPGDLADSDPSARPGDVSDPDDTLRPGDVTDPEARSGGVAVPDDDGGTPYREPYATAPDEVPAHAAPGDVTLFDQDPEQVQARWRELQTSFVDDPGEAVQRADGLVGEVVESLTSSHTSRTDALRDRWKGAESSDTEQLRLALRDYRTVLESLLALSSHQDGDHGDHGLRSQASLQSQGKR
jgi:hypothetical protein